MLRYGRNFKEAAQLLGAWDEAPSAETLRKLVEHEREQEAARLRVEQANEYLMFLRDTLLTARGRLLEIQTELFQSGGEDCWHAAAVFADYIRACDREYSAVAGLREWEWTD